MSSGRGKGRDLTKAGRTLKEHWRVLLVLVLISALSVLLASFLVWRDREDAIARAVERTSSISRLIIAHAEAASTVADRIISIAIPAVIAWDLKDEKAAAAISGLLRRSVGDNNVVASAAVIGAEGNVLVTSRGYPAKPLNIAERPFVRAHKAGVTDPIIMGDPVPGPISGQKRFTFSRAIRNADGSLRAILTAAIQTASFDILYKEVANWPSAETGFYAFGGDVLVQVQTSPRASLPFLMALERDMSHSSRTGGTTVIDANGSEDLVSWSRSVEYPLIYSATSEPMSEVLSTWRSRTLLTLLLMALGNILLWTLSWVAIRMNRARQAATAYQLATREIHHRLKNSLQLISSLIRMRSAKARELETRETVREILVDLQAVAEIHSLLQDLPPEGNIDLCQSLENLCQHLRATYRSDIRLQTAGSVPVNAAHATGLSIIINELVTNSLKHGGDGVDVNCLSANGCLLLQLRNRSGELPTGFTIGEGGGFGLRAVKAMVKGFNGEVTANNISDGGVQFSIMIPLSELLRN